MGSVFDLSPAVTTTDVDEARDQVSRIFCPHRLLPLERGQDVNLRLRSLRLGAVGLIHLDYGAEVRIDPRRLEHFYLVQIPLAGNAMITQNGRSIHSDARCASVLSANSNVSMRWGAGNPQLIFYVERLAVEAELTRMLGRRPPGPIEFDLAMWLDRPGEQSWYRTLCFLRDEVVRDSALLRSSQSGKHLEHMLVTQLLSVQPHTFSDLLTGSEPLASGAVRSACDLINGALSEPLSVVDVAASIGVGVRSLQDGFRRQLETTPSRYIRDRRLERARAVLEESVQGQTSVTEVALSLGVTHLGRFSVHYRRAFGESPSQTLARE